MNVFYLVLRSIGGRQFRSALIAACITAISGFLLITTLLAKGEQHSLKVGLERLGADIIVVPAEKRFEAEAAFLLGKPVSNCWMPEENLAKVSKLEGVERVSPQLYLQSLTGSACCAAWELFIIAVARETDFTVQPWLKKKLNKPLGLRDVVGGQFVIVPEETNVFMLYGTELDLIANLEPTGTGLDQTAFISLETAQFMASESMTKAMMPLEIPEGKISAIQVKVQPGHSLEDMASLIAQELPGVYAITSLGITRTVQHQTVGLFQALMVSMLIVWVVASLLIGLVFFMMVNERRREIGTLRALGASTHFILRMFLTESAMLALGGGIVGVIVATMFVRFFGQLLTLATEAPLLMPPLASLLGFVLACLAVALIVVLPALVYPAVRASRIDPAEAMREV
ncbi:MAG: FtsX-like permease family protein [Proteobacteria bacterium]|nr:FtsX-like permease family protein [Pseudomonadota bacterium]